MTEQDHHSNRSSTQVSGDDSSDDDIWDEGDAVSYDRTIAEREWSRLHDTFGNVRKNESRHGRLKRGAVRCCRFRGNAPLLPCFPLRLCSQDIERVLKKARKVRCNRASIKVGQKACSMDVNWEDFEA